MLRYIVLFLLLSTNYIARSQQVYGCTDPQANNFNAQANINDGSCTYNPTVYKPQIRFMLPDEVNETSGLILWKGGVWTHNDSGGESIIYKLDTVNGTVIQRVKLTNASNIDWEDICQDEGHIYIGDFGNNYGNRDDLAIYIINKEDISDDDFVYVSAAKISFTYSDYSKVDKRRLNNFDCEAMIATEDHLYLFSKNRGDNQSKLYKLPKTAGTFVADKIYTFDASGLVTGADLSQDGKQLVLVGYVNNIWIPFLWVMFDFQDEDFFGGNKKRIDMLNILATQTEGICFTSSFNGFISSETTSLGGARIYNFSTKDWVNYTPEGFLEFNADFCDINIYPNPLKGKKLTVEILNCKKSNYELSVYDSMGRMRSLKKYNFDKGDKKYKLKLNLKKLESGIYYLRIKSGNSITEKKFIKE